MRAGAGSRCGSWRTEAAERAGCSPAEALPPRRLARAAHAGDDRARPSRAAAASERPGGQEVAVALDELGRIEHILERLLLLAKSNQPDFVVPAEIDVEPFLEDVFMRWSEVVPRSWRLGGARPGQLHADPDALRIALDALLENAVKYTEPATRSPSARARGGEGSRSRSRTKAAASRPMASSGSSTASPAPTRRAPAPDGGAGLGLAIVDAIVRAHGGSCAAANSAEGGAVFRCASRPSRRRSATAQPLVSQAPGLPLW